MAERLPLYATYEDLLDELTSLDDESKTVEVPQALRYLATVSRRADQVLGSKPGLPWFGPWVGEVDLPLDPHDVSGAEGWWRLHQPLRSFTTVTGSSGALTPTQRVNKLYLVPPASWRSELLGSCDTAGLEVTIDGLWGWPGGSGDSLDEVDLLIGGMSDAELTSELSIADEAAVDPITGALVYQRGRVLKVDDEFMSVYARDTDSVSVGRGLFGSDKATHLSGAVVNTWSYPDTLTHEVARQAAMLYARRGAFAASAFDGAMVTTYPPDLLKSFLAVLQDFQS